MLDRPNSPQENYILSHSVIEAEVARGYGLDAKNLSEIYDRSRKDRRGLWRHLDASPPASIIVDRVMAEFAQLGELSSAPADRITA